MTRHSVPDRLSILITRAERLLSRIETIFGDTQPNIDWHRSIAFRWRRRQNHAVLVPVNHPHTIRLEDLQCIEAQKEAIEQNTKQFVKGCPANNVLLTGARGTGKSSLIKALLNKYATSSLRLIEVDKQDLIDLPDIVELIRERPERFVLFCDDLSFEVSEPGYKALKAVLDGSIATTSENVLIYATSNRRHLMPEFMQDNLQTKHINDEIHPSEAVEEKISLSERFGVWVSFYPFDQDEYLTVVDYWLKQFGAPSDDRTVRSAALQWAQSRGSRSGRVAWQFARDWVGKLGIRSALNS